MAQPITQTLLQNGSIIGLRLTGSIVDVVNNIESKLDVKADKSALEAVRLEVQAKPSTEYVDSIMSDVIEAWAFINDMTTNKVNTDVFQTLKNKFENDINYIRRDVA